MVGRFCLVTSAHIANNPRLVKEADALSGAGHRVRVVAMDIDAGAAGRDETLLATRHWSISRVVARRSAGWRGALRWLVDGLAQRAASHARRLGVPRAGAWRDRALSRHVAALARAAAAEPADVVVAHNLEALPAAASAARHLGARLAFDIEDLHAEDFSDPRANASRAELIRAVERYYLPRCDLLFASSEGIADAIVEAYGVRRPVVVLNAFPRLERTEANPTRGATPGRAVPTLYWFSQTIGADRGLEDAIGALGRLRRAGTVAELHVRGAVAAGYRERAEAMAAEHGVVDLLHFWPPAPPDEMVALAAEHDVGLALEKPVSRSRSLCVTNKLLTYLAAGIAVAATDTPGQRRVLEDAPGAGFTYPPGDAGAFAESLRALLADPVALTRAKAAARKASERRFSWEVERRILLDAYQSSLVRPAGAALPRPAARAVADPQRT